MKLTDAQRKWCEDRLKADRKWGTRFGRAVDYKLDLVGLGVYFIIQGRNEEVYVELPKKLQSRKAFNMKKELGTDSNGESHAMASREARRQVLREDRYEDRGGGNSEVSSDPR